MLDTSTSEPSNGASDLDAQLKRLSPFDLPVAVYVVQDPPAPGCEPQVVACNDRFRAVFGIAATEKPPFPSSRFYRTPEQRLELARSFEEAKSRGQDLEKLVIRLVAMDGREVRALDFTRPLRDSAGQQVGTLCCLVDMTKEDNVLQLLNALPVGLYHLDRADRIVDCNRQFEELLGAPRHELLSRPASDFYANPEEAREFQRNLIENHTVIDQPLEIVRQDTGETILTSVSSALVGTGNPYQGRVGALRDISQVERYRQIIDHLPVGLFKIRRSARGQELIEHCNEHFASIFGATVDDLLSKPVGELHWSEETYSDYRARLEASDQAKEIVESDVPIRSHGKRGTARVSLRLIKNRQGQVVGRVGAAQDVTKERRLQQKVKRLTSQIGAVLHAYTHTLTTLTQTLHPVEKFLGPDPFTRRGTLRTAAQVIGTGDTAAVVAELAPRAQRVAHSLGRVLAFRDHPDRSKALPTPAWDLLQSLKLALERPRRNAGPEVAYAYFREIALGVLEAIGSLTAGHLPRDLTRQLESDARELGRLTCLLSLASVRYAVIEMDSQVRTLNDNLTIDQREELRVEVGVLELVRTATAAQSEYLHLRDIELRSKLNEPHDSALGRAMVRGAKVDLVRAIGNLLHNAIKYSYSRSSDDSRPWISLRVDFNADGSKVLISIENWGVPLPEDELELVFELGYRGRHSADRNRAGTGVGLHDSREVARDHDGDVKIESRPASSNAVVGPLYSGPFITTATLILPLSRR